MRCRWFILNSAAFAGRLPKLGELPGSWRARHDRIPSGLTKALYAEVKRLATKDASPVRIARQLSAYHTLSLSPGTVRHWIVGDRKPGLRVWPANIFREEPSPALSYIIGANKGDGCALVKSGIVKLEVADKDFAEAFNTNMAKLFSRQNPNTVFVRRRADRLPMYIVKYSCRKLVQLLRQPMLKLLNLASAFPREFLRGFFDAEGHVDVSAGSQFQIRLGAENSDRYVLKRVQHILKEVFGIDSKINRKRESGTKKTIRGKQFTMRRTSFTVLVNRIRDVEVFARRIGFSIARKQEKLNDAVVVARVFPWQNRRDAWKALYSKTRGEWLKRANSPDTAQQ